MRDIDVLFEIGGQPGHVEHQVIALVLRNFLVVPIHGRTVEVELIRRNGAFQGLQNRCGVHSELADEAVPISSA